MKYSRFTALMIAVISLQSCEFSCHVGNTNEPKGKVEVKENGTRLYNGIKAETYKVKLNKAYLTLADGTRVPDDNIVDFKQPIQLHLDIDTGWQQRNGRVWLGASEKVVAEGNVTILEEPDLFAGIPEGISAKDARAIYISATLKLRQDTPPASFSVQFKVWDKTSDGYIEGSYLLFSK